MGGRPDQHAQPRGLGPGPRGLKRGPSGAWGSGRQAPIICGEVATSKTETLNIDVSTQQDQAKLGGGDCTQEFHLSRPS